jgi:hypothetical protein
MYDTGICSREDHISDMGQVLFGLLCYMYINISDFFIRKNEGHQTRIGLNKTENEYESITDVTTSNQNAGVETQRFRTLQNSKYQTTNSFFILVRK